MYLLQTDAKYIPDCALQQPHGVPAIVCEANRVQKVQQKNPQSDHGRKYDESGKGRFVNAFRGEPSRELHDDDALEGQTSPVLPSHGKRPVPLRSQKKR